MTVPLTGWPLRWVISKMTIWGEERQRWDDLLVIFIFFAYKKYSHKIQIEPLMTDGRPWRCFSFFSGPRQCYSLASQWDSHKSPGFYLKYLILCSKTSEGFTGSEQHGGKWLMTKLLPGLVAFTYLGALFSETPNTYQ